MSLEQRGALEELLDAAWLDGGRLPANDSTLAVLSGAGPRWPTIGPAVLTAFFVREGDFFVSPELTEQHAQAQQFVAEQVRKAGLAAEARRKKRVPADAPADMPADEPGDISPSAVSRSAVQPFNRQPTATDLAGAGAPKRQGGNPFPNDGDGPTIAQAAIERAASRYAATFNDVFERHVGVNAAIRESVAEALAAGYSSDDLVIVAIAAAQDEFLADRQADKTLDPEWPLRFKGGHNNQTGRPAKKWLPSLLSRVEFIRVTPRLGEIARKHGVLDALVARGARVLP